MTRFICALAAALAISGVAALGQAPVQPKAGTEKVTPQEHAKAKNLLQDVTTTGCIRAWKPAPDDPTKLPNNDQPGVPGIFVLTPLASNPTAAADRAGNRHRTDTAPGKQTDHAVDAAPDGADAENGVVELPLILNKTFSTGDQEIRRSKDQKIWFSPKDSFS